jgi:hypothetical protein
MDLIIEGIDQMEVDLGIQPAAGMFDVRTDTLAVTFIAEGSSRFGEVLLEVEDLEMPQDFGPSADEEGSSPHEIAGGTSWFGISIGEGNISATEEENDLLGVDRILLDLTAVDGLHIKRMSQEARDPLPLAPIGEPEQLNVDSHPRTRSERAKG